MTTSSSICGLLPLMAMEETNGGLYLSPYDDVDEVDDDEVSATVVMDAIAPMDEVNIIRLDDEIFQ